MNDGANKQQSAHEITRDLNKLMMTLRGAIKDGDLNVVLGSTPDQEPLFIMDWPNCPFFGKITTHFSPKDLENYEHADHPWVSMRQTAKGDKELPMIWVPYQLSDEQKQQCLKKLSEGRVVCPATGTEAVRFYDFMMDIQRSETTQMKMLFTSSNYRWSLSFVMGTQVALQITDVEEKQNNPNYVEEQAPGDAQ